MSYLIIGNFGYKTNQLDGQTIKTRNVYSLLSSKLKDSLFYYDTSSFSWIKLICEIFKHHTFYVLPAHNAIRVLIPLLYIISLFRPIKIVYIQIGGWLSEFLKNRKFLCFCLARIDRMMIETQGQMKELENFNFSNLRYVPNFRLIENMESVKLEEIPLKIVFCARIQKEKGIENIFKLASYIFNNSKLKGNCIIDFYGIVDSKDAEYFKSMLSKYDFVNYKGILQPEEVSINLSYYDFLILPTHYYTEGFPGSILDSYLAGIPVIVTQWKHAFEFVENNKTGIILPFTDFQADLNHCVLELFENRDQLALMKKFATIKGKNFAASSVIDCFKDTF